MIDKMAQEQHVHSHVRMLLLVFGVILVASNLRASLTAVGPLVGAIIVDTGMSNALAGLLTTLPLIAFSVFSLFAPRLVRRFGMEYSLLGSLIILSVGIALRSVPSIWALFIGTAVLGLAIAVGNVLLPSLIKREFPARIGLLTGIYTVSMSSWAAIASGVSIPISQGLGLGWRNALLCWVILSLVAILLWFPLLRFCRQQHSYNNEVKDESLWHSKLAWQVTLFMGLQSIGFYATVTWLPEMLNDRGLSSIYAGWMLSFMQFVSLPAALFVPWLAGRIDSQRGIVFAIAIFLVFGYVGLLFGETRFVYLFVGMLGLGQGASISLALTFISLRTASAQQAAELSGMAQSIGYLLAAVAPVLLGFLHDLTQAWTLAFLVLIAISLFQLMAGLGAGKNIQVGSRNIKGVEAEIIRKESV